MIATRYLALGTACLALAWTSAGALARPANTLDELHAALSACARIASPSPAWSGSVLTVRFILAATGHLMGPPRVTYVKLAGASEVHKAFRTAALAAVDSCFPLSVTGGLGAAISDRLILLTVEGSGPGQVRIPPNQR